MKTLFNIAGPFLVALCSTLLSACGGGDGPADPRNASYIGYATNGERFTLTVDFGRGRFTFQGAAPGSPALEGGFGNDTVAGTYVFDAQAGAGRTARFRHVDGLIVGNYNFSGAVRPFIASRQFAQSFVDAAETYNNLGVSGTPAGDAETTVYASRIVNGGSLQTCADSTIYAVDKCPASSLRNRVLSISGDVFTAAPAAPGEAPFSFRIARAAGEKIFLMADIAANGTRSFQVGVAESGSFRSGNDWGGTVQGAWARADYTARNYSSEGVAVDGSASNYNGPLAGLGADAPQGILSYDAAKALVVQNTQLTVLAGTRKGTSAGFMQIGAR